MYMEQNTVMFKKYNDQLLCGKDYEQAVSALPRVKVVCHVCEEEVQDDDETTLVVRGRPFHSQCFSCANCKQKPKPGQEVTIRDKTVYCCDNEPVISCHGCTKPMKRGEPTLSAGHKTWHRICFRCCRCSIVITDEFFFHDLKQHCLRCYKRHCNVTCITCDQLILGSVINAGNKRYHPQCAFCSVCGGHFTQGNDMLVEDDEIWHPKCSDLRSSIRQMEGYLSSGATNTSFNSKTASSYRAPLPSTTNNTSNAVSVIKLEYDAESFFRNTNGGRAAMGLKKTVNTNPFDLANNPFAAIPRSLPLKKSQTFLNTDYNSPILLESPEQENYHELYSPQDHKPVFTDQALRLNQLQKTRIRPLKTNRRKVSSNVRQQPTIVESELEAENVQDETAATLFENISKQDENYSNLRKVAQKQTYVYNDLRTTNDKLPPSVDRDYLEQYLSEREFKQIFQMSKAEFAQMPAWKRDSVKKSKYLF